MSRRGKRLKIETAPVGTAPERTLYPGRAGWLLVLVASLVFCAGAWAMLPREPVMGWLGLGFFGIGVVVSGVLVLFPGVSSLRLTADGFLVRALFRSHFTRWQDVSSFSVASMHAHTMVVYNYAPSYVGQELGRNVARGLTGWEAALGDTYGLSAEELADLMNEWKRRWDITHA